MRTRPLTRLIILGFTLAAGLCQMGCSRQKTDRPETYPASGVLFVDEEPAAGAKRSSNPVQFMFMPINPAQSKRLAATCPHAVVQGDGSFRLTTYRTNDGARRERTPLR